MNRRHVDALVRAAAAVLGAACIDAQAQRFLEDLPVSRMTPQDIEIARTTIRKALDEGKEGERYAWENPATGASGAIVVRAAAAPRNGAPCRRAEFVTSAGGRKHASAWTLCKLPDGWKAVV